MRVRDFLPPESLEEIRAVPRSEVVRVGDSTSWGLSPNGVFSVASAFTAVSRGHTNHEGMYLSWIWWLKCPERVRFFLWNLVQDKLNSNEVRHRKGMTPNPYCTLCGNITESTDHVVRSCPLARMVWNKVGGINPFFSILQLSSIVLG